MTSARFGSRCEPFWEILDLRLWKRRAARRRWRWCAPAPFDAVLLDINMPGMGGIEVCRLMRKAAPRLPILMLTVQGGEERKVEALDAGADDYITKPSSCAS